MTKKQRGTKTPKNFDPKYQEEIEKAGARIGKDNFAGMDWLLRFIQTDLNAMSQGELMDLGFELNRLADFQYSDGMEALGLSEYDWKGNNRFQKDSDALTLAQVVLESNIRPPMEPPSISQIKELQNVGKTAVDQFLESGCFGLTLPSTRVVAYSMENIGDGIFTMVDQPKDLFVHNIFLLLAYGFPRIRRCPTCQTIFFADRKNKKSCSVRCQNTAAVRRIRQEASALKGSHRKKLRSSKSKQTTTSKKGGV